MPETHYIRLMLPHEEAFSFISFHFPAHGSVSDTFYFFFYLSVFFSVKYRKESSDRTLFVFFLSFCSKLKEATGPYLSAKQVTTVKSSITPPPPPPPDTVARLQLRSLDLTGKQATGLCLSVNKRCIKFSTPSHIFVCVGVRGLMLRGTSAECYFSPLPESAFVWISVLRSCVKT